MQRAVIRNTYAPGLGVTVAWVSLIASSNVVLVAAVNVYFLWSLGGHGSVRLSLLLLGGLTLVYIPWILAVVRGWIPATTCGGLVLASCGLAAYAVAECGRWWIGLWMPHRRPAEVEILETVLTRLLFEGERITDEHEWTPPRNWLPRSREWSAWPGS